MSTQQIQETRKRPHHDLAEPPSQQEDERDQTDQQAWLDTRVDNTRQSESGNPSTQERDSVRKRTRLDGLQSPHRSASELSQPGSRHNHCTSDDLQTCLPPSSASQSCQSNHEGIPSALSTPLVHPEDDTDLCEDCRTIDLVAAFARKPRWLTVKWKDAMICTRTIADDMWSSKCRLCSLLQRVRLTGGKGEFACRADHRFDVFAWPYCMVTDGSAYPLKYDAICLLVVPSGAFQKKVRVWPWDVQRLLQQQAGIQAILQHTKQTEKVYGLALAADHIDYSRIRSWILRHSSQPGGYLHTGTQHDNHDQITAKVPGLYLVDCESLQICKYNSQPYVTLSYVWGQSAAEYGEDWRPIVGKGLPALVPLTIQDAIQVTKFLGFRFLWIDQYCIRQSDNQHKATQVAAMDTIYSCSALTIIAAAGDDVQHGLPGVSTRWRSYDHSTVRVGGLDLVTSPLSRPETLISNSRWASRGWTYQEGLLSRSRLVFTAEQVYFEEHLQPKATHWPQRSKTANACYQVQLESLKYPDNVQYGPTKSVYGYFRSGCTAKQVRVDRNEKITSHIKSFAQRQLSYESDVHAAILGVYNASSYRSYWGLPIAFKETITAFHNGRFEEKNLRRILQDKFACMLCWSHNDADTSKRRLSFPSFSWTGWTGVPNLEKAEATSRSSFKKRLHYGGSDKSYLTLRPVIKISFPELELERMEPSETIEWSHSSSLLVDAGVVKLVISMDNGKKRWHPYPGPEQDSASELRSSRFNLYLPQVHMTVQRITIECVKVIEARAGNDDNWTLKAANTQLLVIKRFDDHVERIGFLRASYKYHEWIKELPVTKERLVLR